MKRCLNILFIAVCALIVGTAGLSATLSWPKGEMGWPDTETIFTSVLFSPLLALRAWSVFFLILPLVVAMWSIRTPGIVPSAWLFLLIGSLVGAGIGWVLAGEPALRLAFAVGSCLAGTVSNALIVLLKSTTPNKGAPPNGGHVTPAGDSTLLEGPPLVS